MTNRLPEKVIINFQKSLLKETGFEATYNEAENWSKEIYDLLELISKYSLNSELDDND